MSAASWYRIHADSLTLTLHVQPGAKRSEIVGLHSDALKIKLAAPPVEGKANAALLRFIAKQFQVSLHEVALHQGASSRHKVVSISNTRIAPASLLKQT